MTRVLGLAALLCLPRLAGAAPPGTILITPDQVELGGKDLDAKVKKAAVKSVTKGESGEWKFFLVAWLRKAPGSSQVALLFYDVAEKAQKEPNNVIEIGAQPSAKILATNVSFGDDANLKPGHTYNIVIARKVGGKDEVYAKGQIELKAAAAEPKK